MQPFLTTCPNLISHLDCHIGILTDFPAASLGPFSTELSKVIHFLKVGRIMSLLYSGPSGFQLKPYMTSPIPLFCPTSFPYLSPSVPATPASLTVDP